MRIRAVFLRDVDDDFTWLEEARTEDQIAQDEQGWMAAVDEAREYKGVEMRLMFIDIPDDAIEQAFAKIAVEGTAATSDPHD